MKITVEEALELRVWTKLCDIKGIDVWAVKEGLIDRDEEITLTLNEATVIGIIKD